MLSERIAAGSALDSQYTQAKTFVFFKYFSSSNPSFLVTTSTGRLISPIPAESIKG